MQGNAKARIEGALNHPLAMNFKDARCGETAHQRLPHFGRIGTGLRRKHQRLRHRCNVECHNDLIGHFAGLTVAVAADQCDVFAQQIEQRFDVVKRRLRAANHGR